MSAPIFKKVQQNRMSDSIANQILEAIKRGDLKSNDKLPSENELTKVFGASRATVREAIRSLEQFGLIEVHQGSQGGAYIKKMDISAVVEQVENALKMTNITVHQLTEARIALEEIIMTKLIPSKIQAENFVRLEKNISITAENIEKKRYLERHVCNFEFHAMIAEITENPIIILTHKLILSLMFDFYKNVNPTELMVQQGTKEHKMIVEFMKNADFQKASELSTEHIRKSSALISKKSKQQSKFKESR